MISPKYKVLESSKSRVVLEGDLTSQMPPKIVFVKGKSAWTLWKTEEDLEEDKRVAAFTNDE